MSQNKEINSSPPSAAYMHQWIRSALVQKMACHLFSAKPLTEPMLAHYQLNSWEQISVKFEMEFYHFDSRYSVSPIYRGRVYRGIGYIAVACWTPFFGAQERDIFREIAVTPWTQFAGDNFSRNLLTVIAFVPGSQETIFREINSSLPVNAGWNTCCATVSHVRRSIDTPIVL